VNIYIVSSPGGHLNETLSMVEAFEDCHVYLITLNFPNMKDISFDCIEKVYPLRLFFDYSVKFGLPLTLLAGVFTMLRAFLAHRPHMIFSTGSEIALPAFVSTLCICIVFAPIAFLTGAAKSLFVPLAMAVVFAMLMSYVLSRTLLPTMVRYLLAKEAMAHHRPKSWLRAPR